MRWSMKKDVNYYIDLIKKSGATIKIWDVPTLKRLEIEIISFCNLKCYGCNRFCSQAPTKDLMTVEQIDKFVNESIDLNYKWEIIAILGGEPTMHPNLADIINLIEKYRAFNPSVQMVFATNGTNWSVTKELPEYYRINNSRAIKNTANDRNIISTFHNMLYAPIDRKEKDLLKYRSISSCGVTINCGMGLTKYGYMACGTAAAIARVLGLDIFIKSLKELTTDECIKQLSVLCAFCGMAGGFGKVKGWEGNFEQRFSENSDVSDFWKTALEEYKRNRPTIKEY